MEITEQLRQLIDWDKGLDELENHEILRMQIQNALIYQDIVHDELTILNIENKTRYFIFAIDWARRDACFYEISEEESFQIRNIVLFGKIEKINHN